MKERQIIGEGREHAVYKKDSDPDHIYKVPKRKTLLVTLREDRVGVLKKELEWAKDFVKNSEVVIPPTRIFPFKKRYVITQPYIQEDNSVNPKDFFTKESNAFLETYYSLHPENFMSEKGTMYWIDPAKGYITRLLEEKFHLQSETYWEIKKNVKRRLQKG